MNLTTFTLSPAQPAGYNRAATSAILELDGVGRVMLSASAQTLNVTFYAQNISPMELLQALAAAGFQSAVVLPALASNESCCGACT